MSTTHRFCTEPDRDVPKLRCGYPLPCPHHTVVVDASSDAVTLTVPHRAKRPSEAGRRRLIEIGAMAKGERRPSATRWKRTTPKQCDLCDRPAVWAHPAGGVRCNTCPRPEGA